jgi:hypothetical protein
MAPTGMGGGILNMGSVSMSNVTISGNAAEAGGDGIADVLGGTVIGASVAGAGNTAKTGNGGGILNSGGGARVNR